MKKTKIFGLMLVILLFAKGIHAEILFPKIQLKDVNERSIKEYLQQNILQLLPNETLVLDFVKNTKNSQHFTFQLYYKNTAVHNCFIKINVDNNGNILCIANDIANTEALQNASTLFADEKKIALKYNFTKNDIVFTPIFYKENNSFLPILLCRKSTVYTDSSYFINANYEIINSINNGKNLKIDTTIHAKVFNPDPLTTMHQYYGGVYKNNSDADAPWLDSALQSVDFTGLYDTDSSKFYLENSFVKIVDIDLPNIAPATQTNANFYFNRSQTGFEDCMAMYHISNFHAHVASLGFDTLMKLQVNIDTHSQNGLDNSTFFNGNGAPYILYGIGGVNDAEDADVLVHEYCHGISWSANKNLFQSNERLGLDEGLADYFATSYSKNIDTFRWADMFTWDGHNEFWAGRTANTFNNYPDLSGDYYKTGEIWNCAMMKIWDKVGRNIADKLMLEAMHFFTNSTILPEAAMYVLQSDSLLYAGVHTTDICTAFYQKNILSGACGGVPIATITKPNQSVAYYNTLGFAENASNLQVVMNKNCTTIHCLLTNEMGQHILENNFSNCATFSIANPNLQTGIYFLQILVDGERFTKKLVVY